MREGEKTRELTFRYIFDDLYNPVYVNGAYGGLSPRGEIVMNFFLERTGLPYSQTHAVGDDGTLGKVVGKEPEDQVVVRFVTTGIVLSTESAKTIHKWLGEWIGKAEAARSGEAEQVDNREQ